MTESVKEVCDLCGDSLTLHIGGKPCVDSKESYVEWRARLVREQGRKRVVRLWGEDAR